MPIVFVHGVNNRKGDPGYEARRILIEQFLAQHLKGVELNGKTLSIAQASFPYWGDEATKFAWKMASVPSMHSGAQALGALDDDMRGIVATIHDRLGELAPGQEEPLVTMAKASFTDAVELVSDIMLGTSPEDASDSQEIAEFVVAAQTYAEKNQSPVWLADITTDQQFTGRLLTEVQQAPTVNALGNPFKKIGKWLTLGAGKVKNAVKKAVGTAVDTAGDFASTALLAWTRKGLNGTLGRFFGDVFVYMDARGDKNAPGNIPAIIIPEFKEVDGEPLIIIAHSLGGVISYDLLTHFLPNVQVDLLVTVGSQVSHFEEIKRFHVSEEGVPSAATPKVKKPANVKHWINIFDPVDIFSYRCEPVFDGVKDYDYNTRTYVIKAHGAYFDQKRFYVRLRDRIDELI